MDAKLVHVYLDTSILANWILNYFKRPKDIRPEKRAKECIDLFAQVKSGEFSCQFETSSWSLAELSQSVMDNIIASKILRDGFSLVYFNKLKRNYELSVSEQKGALIHIEYFTWILGTYNILIRESAIDHRLITKFSHKYHLETPDATHVALSMKNCQFLVSIDTDLLDAKPPIMEVQVVRPSTLYCNTNLRQ